MGVIFNRYGGVSKAMVEGVRAAILETGTLIDEDVKGGPHSLYRAYPEKPSYVRTGNLGRSYHLDAANLMDPIVPSVEIGNDPGIADYVPYVEFGTVNMAAEPHLTPTTEAQRIPHVARVQAAVAKGAVEGSA